MRAVISQLCLDNLFSLLFTGNLTLLLFSESLLRIIFIVFFGEASAF